MMTDLQIAGNTVFGVLIKKRLHFNLKVLSKIFKKIVPLSISIKYSIFFKMVSDLLSMRCKISDSTGEFSCHRKVTGDLRGYNGEPGDYHIEFV
jgi:hypothetical protein